MVLLHFVCSGEKFDRLHMDGSGELSAAACALSWRRDASTPQRPQSNGVVEQAVRRLLEGARSLLMQWVAATVLA